MTYCSTLEDCSSGCEGLLYAEWVEESCHVFIPRCKPPARPPASLHSAPVLQRLNSIPYAHSQLTSFTLLQFSDRYEIHADLPGMPKSSIGVSIDEDTWPQTLTITAHRSIEGPARGEQGEAGDQPADASVVDVGGTEAEKGESLKPSAPRSVSQGEAGATRKAAGKDESEEGKGKHASTSSHSPSTKNSSVQAWHRTERVSGTVSRTLALPSDADTAGVGARLEEGVLTVTVPRKKVAEAEEIPGRRRVTIE